MSRLRTAHHARTGERMSRTTLSIDADTAVALQWLRSPACSDPVAASRLLRDAAAQALAAEGKAIVLGQVVSLEERAAHLEAQFAKTLAG